MNSSKAQIQPSVPRKRRRWLRWIGYLTVAGLALVVVLACVGAIYEAIASHRDRALFHAPGRLVDVGGHRLHLYCVGAGSPTVLLEAGGGNPWLAWYKVQPRVAQFTRVCSYDRAGLGWSDPSPKPPTAREIATELHTLVGNAGIAGPYVLVGHSLGGMYVRMFQSLYPNEVVGLVLVDSSHPDQDARFPPEARKLQARSGQVLAVIQFLRPFGVVRLLVSRAAPPEVRAEYAALLCRPQYLRALRAESAEVEENDAEVRPLGALGDLPLAVLSHDPDKVSFGNLSEPVNRAWDEMQTELSHLSTRGTHEVVKGASHDIEIDVPDAVVNAIRRVFDQASPRRVIPTAVKQRARLPAREYRGGAGLQACVKAGKSGALAPEGSTSAAKAGFLACNIPQG